MNMKYIIYQQDNEAVAVVVPANCGLTIEQIAAKDVPQGIPYTIIDASDLPVRDEFRNAWAMIGGKVCHDMVKARSIKREQLRVERKPLLEALDVEYMLALEKGDKVGQANITAQKQKLRDAPADPRIEKAKTVDDLTAIKLRS